MLHGAADLAHRRVVQGVGTGPAASRFLDQQEEDGVIKPIASKERGGAPRLRAQVYARE